MVDALTAREKYCSTLASCGRCEETCLNTMKCSGNRSRISHVSRHAALPEVARNVDPLLSQLLHWLLEERESVLRDRGLLLVGGLALAHLVRYGWRESGVLAVAGGRRVNNIHGT